MLADWLGSNTLFFPYESRPQALGTYWSQALRQAEIALAASGVLPPTRLPATDFGTLFPALPTPSPLQRWAAAQALTPAPQVHLLEDVTGAGKTEAALMLAHRLMAADLADGFYIALPTMATAHAMYGRLAQVYGQLFAHAASLVLATGQRDLVESFARSVLPADHDERDPRQADQTASARCAAWLADHRKRALLSPAGVGTIDQAMLAVLYSRHQSLRLLGLARKVLVVDEVHACDDYMLGVLAVLLRFHARAGGSAVLLSATLPQRMRQRLLDAFADGRQEPRPQAAATAYPLATSWPAAGGEPLAESPLATRPDVQRRVRVRCSSDVAEIEAAIVAALAAGRCVCWVRNTVADAVQACERLAGRVPADRLQLFHARYALHDRLATEERVLAAFGNTSGPTERAGRLLVATQVVEQSLDVDFDLLVTDLAPIDRIVQRAGRLARHRRDRDGRPLAEGEGPDRRGEPCVWVLMPPWTDAPGARWFQTAFPKAAHVYPNHGQLWLTARALREGGFTMPDDARRLIEGVFGADAEMPAGLQANALAAEGLGFAALARAQSNTLNLDAGYERSGFDWWDDARTPTRLGEASTTVALACWDGGRLRPWADRAHGWAYSSLRVGQRWIDAEAPAVEPALRAALDAAHAELPAQGRWTVLLPLARTARGWVGEALAAPRAGTRGRPAAPARRLSWRYDAALGLRLDDDGNAPRGDGTAQAEEPDE